METFEYTIDTSHGMIGGITLDVTYEVDDRGRITVETDAADYLFLRMMPIGHAAPNGYEHVAEEMRPVLNEETLRLITDYRLPATTTFYNALLEANTPEELIDSYPFGVMIAVGEGEDPETLDDLIAAYRHAYFLEEDEQLSDAVLAELFKGRCLGKTYVPASGSMKNQVTQAFDQLRSIGISVSDAQDIAASDGLIYGITKTWEAPSYDFLPHALRDLDTFNEWARSGANLSYFFQEDLSGLDAVLAKEDLNTFSDIMEWWEDELRKNLIETDSPALEFASTGPPVVEGEENTYRLLTSVDDVIDTLPPISVSPYRAYTLINIARELSDESYEEVCPVHLYAVDDSPLFFVLADMFFNTAAMSMKSPALSLDAASPVIAALQEDADPAFEELRKERAEIAMFKDLIR